jgi:hypothetical protein
MLNRWFHFDDDDGLTINLMLDSNPGSVDLDFLYRQGSTMRQEIIDNPIFQVSNMKMSFDYRGGNNCFASVTLKAEGVEDTREVREALGMMAMRTLR